MIPIISTAKLVGVAGVFMVLVASHAYVYYRGGISERDKLLSNTLAKIRQASDTEQTLRGKVDRLARQLAAERNKPTVTETIYRTVDVYVPKEIDTCRSLPAGFRVLHDAAALGTPPEGENPSAPSPAPVNSGEPIDLTR